MTRPAPEAELLSLGPLRVREVSPRGPATASDGDSLTVVLLHGYGASGHDLVSLAERVDAPAATTFIFPEAPGILDDLVLLNLVEDARVWWARDARRLHREVHGDHAGHAGKETTVFEEIAPARDAVIAMLDALEQRPGPTPRIVLGGFSQGAILALEVATRDTRPLAGLVLLSGTMTDDVLRPQMATRRGLPVFQAHGTADARLSFETAERLRDAMTDAGMVVSFCAFEDGHGIPDSVAHALGRWLRLL
jgi:phospholipase/carboxylesterase